MDMHRYLDRIEFDREVRIDYETLFELAANHQRSVPFENLDNHLGVPTVLDVDAIFRKIVHRRRGGTCYELNFLFGTLLRRLGFTLDFLSARVFGRNNAGMDFDHATLCVVIRGVPYLADVGFGDGFFAPMELRSGCTSEYCNHQFRIEERGGQCILESSRSGELDKGLSFELIPRRIEEFFPMNRYHARNPMSLRSRRLIVTRATENGRISLVNNRRTEYKYDETIRCEISDDDYVEILSRDFGLDIPFKPRVKATRLIPRLRGQFYIARKRAYKLWSLLTRIEY